MGNWRRTSIKEKALKKNITLVKNFFNKNRERIIHGRRHYYDTTYGNDKKYEKIEDKRVVAEVDLIISDIIRILDSIPTTD